MLAGKRRSKTGLPVSRFEAHELRIVEVGEERGGRESGEVKESLASPRILGEVGGLLQNRGGGR